MLTNSSNPMGSAGLDGLGGRIICMDIWDIFAHGFFVRVLKAGVC